MTNAQVTQSPLLQACREHGITLQLHYLCEDMTPEGWRHDAWKAELLYRGKSILTDYRTGLGHRPTGVLRPLPGSPAHKRNISAADVLSSLLLDASSAGETFESWCAELGYNSDSRKALDIYLQCQAIAAKLHTLLGPKLLAELSTIEH